MTEKQTSLNEQNAAQDARVRQLLMQEDDEETIDLVDLFYVLLNKWAIILASTLLCAVVAGVYVFAIATPKYQATATIYVLARTDSDVNISELNVGSALVNDYIKVFDMWEVHEQVISNLDLDYTYNEMSSKLEISNDSDTRMLDISFTSESAQEAADVANEYVEVASEYIESLMKVDKPSIMSSALVPSTPVSPNKGRIIIVGALIGFVISAGVIAVKYLMDDTYKTAEDIKKYAGLVTLASIPVEKAGEHGVRSKGKKSAEPKPSEG